MYAGLRTKHFEAACKKLITWWSNTKFPSQIEQFMLTNNDFALKDTALLNSLMNISSHWMCFSYTFCIPKYIVANILEQHP